MPLDPYVIKSEENKTVANDGVNMTGLFIEILDILSKRINLTVTEKIAPKYDYNAAIELVSKGYAKIGIGDFSITYHRSFKVDFSISVNEEKCTLF